MKLISTIVILLLSQITFSQNLQQFTKDAPFTYVKAPEGDRSMIDLSGQSLRTSSKHRALGVAMTLVGGGMLGYGAANPVVGNTTSGSFRSEEPNPLLFLGSAVTLLGLGFQVSSVIQLNKSGMYLQAHANGVIITF